MKNVLFLISTLNSGGAEKVLVDTVNSLDKSKYQITVQTIFDEGVNKSKLFPHIRYKTIIGFPRGFIRRIIAFFLFKVLGCGFVHKAFIDDNYDYEIAFLEGLPTKIISKSSNKRSKKYTWLHTDIYNNPRSYQAYGSRSKEEIAYKSFDKVFCVSENVKSSLLNTYRLDENKLFVLYNIIDDEAIVFKSNEHVNLPTDIRPLFVTAGRLEKVKGYYRLLKVHHRLINEGYIHSLIIIGDGSEKDKLANYIYCNQLNNTAFLLGFKSNPYKYFSKADLFICSSYAEGYSTVVSEAILCGVPVLSTDVSGANEPIDSPRCTIITDNNEEAIYKSIKELLSRPQMLLYYRDKIDSKKEVLSKKHLVDQFEKCVFNC